MNPPQANHETGNPLVADAACGAGLSGAQRARIIRPSFSPSCKLYEQEAGLCRQQSAQFFHLGSLPPPLAQVVGVWLEGANTIF
jgi:hypothetical protein